ncbi:MAG: hypothetical protein JNM43_05605 [Planctomycetaceae bacterium]|nr:hypothetical protein [Planctomycetaceae bacterium]
MKKKPSRREYFNMSLGAFATAIPAASFGQDSEAERYELMLRIRSTDSRISAYGCRLFVIPNSTAKVPDLCLHIEPLSVHQSDWQSMGFSLGSFAGLSLRRILVTAPSYGVPVAEAIATSSTEEVEEFSLLSHSWSRLFLRELAEHCKKKINRLTIEVPELKIDHQLLTWLERLDIQHLQIITGRDSARNLLESLNGPVHYSNGAQLKIVVMGTLLPKEPQ